MKVNAPTPVDKLSLNGGGGITRKAKIFRIELFQDGEYYVARYVKETGNKPFLSNQNYGYVKRMAEEKAEEKGVVFIDLTIPSASIPVQGVDEWV